MADGVILQVGVKAFIKNEKGEYLLAKRDARKYAEVNNPWDIVGGRIDPGAPLIENLAREIREETGMELHGVPRLIAAQDILRGTERPASAEATAGRHIVRLTYRAEAEGEPVLSDEHTEFRWASIEEMKAMEGLDRYVREIIERGDLS